MGFGVQGVGFRVQGSGFRVQGVGGTRGEGGERERGRDVDHQGGACHASGLSTSTFDVLTAQEMNR